MALNRAACCTPDRSWTGLAAMQAYVIQMLRPAAICSNKQYLGIPCMMRVLVRCEHHDLCFASNTSNGNLPFAAKWMADLQHAGQDDCNCQEEDCFSADIKYIAPRDA